MGVASRTNGEAPSARAALPLVRNKRRRDAAAAKISFDLARGWRWDTSLASLADAIVMAEFNRHDVGAETIAAISLAVAA